MYYSCRKIIIVCLLMGAFFCVDNTSAQSENLVSSEQQHSEIWADKIIELLPSDSRITPLQDVTISTLQDAELDDIRRAVQDVLSDRLVLDLDTLLKLYRQRALEAGVEREVSLAKLYKAAGRPGTVTDFNVFTPFLQSSDWFIVVSAYTEMTRQYNFSSSTLAAESLKKAVLNLSDGANLSEYLEAQYNILVVAQTLTVVSGDLEAAYKTSKLLLDSSAAQDRILDRSIIVFNLAQLHGASFNGESNLRVTEALLSYSKNLNKEGRMPGMLLHGSALLAAGDAKAGIVLLEEASKLADETGDEYFKIGVLFDLATAYVSEGKIIQAEKAVDEIVLLQGGEDDQFLAPVRAKIARKKGDFEAADRIQTAIAKEYYSLYSQSQLNRKLDFDFNILEFVPAPSRNKPRSAPAINLMGYSGGVEIEVLEDGLLPGDLYRSLKEFEIEVQLMDPQNSAYEDTADGMRRKFMDAAFDRSALDAELSLTDYRRVADARSELDNEFLKLFEQYIRALNGIETVFSPTVFQHSQTKAYARLLSAKASLENNSVESLYFEVANAKYAGLSLQARDDFDFDLSNLELILAAMEGNPDLALKAATQHIKLGVKTGRVNEARPALSSVLIALERAGYSDEALALSNQFKAINRIEGGPLEFNYLYTHGRLLNSASRYEDAILFLETAREQLVDPENEPLVLRQLLVSYAATSKNDFAKIIKRELLLSLNKINDPALTDTSGPILARADYLLAKNLSSEEIESLRAAYHEAELEQFDAQKQYQLRLSALRVKADSLATANWIEEANFQKSKLDTKLSKQRSSQFGALAITLLALAGFATIVIKNRQLKKETLKHLRAAQVKGQFLNLIGHEARVNLQGISSFVQSLKASSVSMEHLPTVQVIGSHASSLSQSISDFIFSARIISGDRPIKEQQLNLIEYKSRMLPVWQDNIGGRDVVISVDISPKIPPLLLDTFFLETAMSQVVKIAIETTRIGTVEIEFTDEQSLKGLRLNVVVEDMGSGIANEDLNSIFDFFEVDENGVSKTAQTQPLGYPIAKNAVEAMGGVMTITSKPGRGTRVAFSIPVKRAAANDLMDVLDG